MAVVSGCLVFSVCLYAVNTSCCDESKIASDLEVHYLFESLWVVGMFISS